MARKEVRESLFAALTLALVYTLLFTRFDMRLLFSDTILTGGDSASWYQVLATLKNDFLPRGRLFGFSQANFFGYLEGQHYFILPFLTAALIGFIAPLTVALKIATVAGGFALPATMFVAAASISGRKRAGALASASSLLFLFNESYTIFGGNWLSTFAGEFCFSWAIALLPLFVASVVADMSDDNRKGILSGFLLGLIGLSHFFVFMPAFFLPFLAAFPALPSLLKKKGRGRYRSARRSDAEATLRILVTYGLAILVMAFWLLPMAATRIWAQPISIIWNFSSLKDFARQTLAWVWAPLGLVFAGALLSGKISRDKRRFLGLTLYALAACAFLFFAAPGLGMPDIRFIPSALLICALGASILGESFLARLERGEPGLFASSIPSLTVLALAIAACAGAAAMAKNAPAWFRWNYSGYEAKREWSAIEALGETYRGTPDDGRFLWEKQDQRDNSDFGSERGFENLSLFTGHPTSEGIHYGSSMMARAATYLQSSYSPNPVDPEAERIYSEIDPQSWPARFSLLNARYIVTHSDEIKAMFAAHPGFALDSVKGKFAIYRYKEYPGNYVQILPDQSLSIVEEGPGGFRADYYRFFREYELYGHPFVSAEFADGRLRSMAKASGGSWKSYDEYRSVNLARAAVGEPTAAPRQDPIKNEHIDNFGISFDTAAPGVPHLIKISYAPGWRSRAREKIYPVSPGFMLIVPQTNHVDIVYGRTGWEIAGLLLSILSLPAAFALRRILPGRRFPWRLLLGIAFAIFAGAAIFLALQTSAGYPALAKDIGEARRLDLGIAAQRQKALDLVEPWATTENLDRFDNRLAFDAFRIKVLVLLRQGRRTEASALIETLKSRYPHTRALESLPDL